MNTYAISFHMTRTDPTPGGVKSSYTHTLHARKATDYQAAVLDAMNDAFKSKPGYQIAGILWMQTDGAEAGAGGAIPPAQS